MMKSLKIFSLVLLFSLLVIFVPRVNSAGDRPNQGSEENCCTWTAGRTSVSDLPPEQRNKLHGLKLPEGYWEMWEKLPKFEPLKGITLPTRFDWRDSNVVTPAKNQLQCGSCWDFCAVGALEAMVKKYGEVEMDLSEQQVLSCKTYGTGCSGSYPDLAYQLFQYPGAAKEECMPYQANDMVPCTQSSCEKWARISNYTTVSNNVDAIKNAIYTQGPLSTLMAAPDTFSYYTGGCFNYMYTNLNHCVMLVGWDDTICNGQGAWIGKNSWGPGWGMNGFFYIRWGSCLIGTGTEYPNYIFHRPYVRLENYGVSDSAGGNGNGRPEPQETVRLDFTLKNVWSPLGNVGVNVTVNPSDIIITDDYSYLGNMASKEIKDNSSDPMQFQVPANFPSQRIYFTFHVSGDSGGGVIYHADTTVEVWVGQANVLLVDDDSSGSGTYADYESYYLNSFDSLGIVYEAWDKQAKGNFSFSLSKYQTVIWYTGDHRTSLFSQADIESLMSFLDNGGRLFLTSQDAAEALSGSGDPLDSIFLTNYLHCRLDNDSATQRQVKGVPGDSIGDTLYIYLWGTGSPQNQISEDVLLPDSSAITCLNYTGSHWAPVDGVAGLRFKGDYRLVFFGFGFEGMNQTPYSYQGHYLPRAHFVMQRVMDWLEGPLPTINVTSPNGGETWFIGDTADIMWQSISFEGNVKIEYSTDGGVVWLTIVDTTTNDGVYSWPVPQDTTILSDSCLVKVSDIDNGIPFDISDNYFSITNYVSGDANGDGVVNSADVGYLINYLFIGGPAPQFMAAGDANGDCTVNSADVGYLINYLFVGGPTPQPGCA
jgi:hypothetical protein